MAGVIGKGKLRGSKNHKQQVGLRGAAGYLSNRRNRIDSAVDSAQTGAGKKIRRKKK